MVIAHRRLIIADPAGDQEVSVRLYQPEQDDSAWSCRCEIDWPDQPWSSRACGVDPIQAVIIALQMIGIRIYTSAYHAAGTLRWLEHGQGYGFPVTSNVRDVLVGDDRTL